MVIYRIIQSRSDAGRALCGSPRRILKPDTRGTSLPVRANEPRRGYQPCRGWLGAFHALSQDCRQRWRPTRSAENQKTAPEDGLSARSA
jgi:hypothetical protein